MESRGASTSTPVGSSRQRLLPYLDGDTGDMGQVRFPDGWHGADHAYRVDGWWYRWNGKYLEPYAQVRYVSPTTRRPPTKLGSVAYTLLWAWVPTLLLMSAALGTAPRHGADPETTPWIFVWLLVTPVLCTSLTHAARAERYAAWRRNRVEADPKPRMLPAPPLRPSARTRPAVSSGLSPAGRAFAVALRVEADKRRRR